MSEGLLIFLISQAVALLIGMIGIYVKISIKIKELELRVRVVEKQDSTIINKLDNLGNQLTDMRVMMENKQDRP